MFGKSDLEYIKSRGSKIEVILQQIENFRTGFPAAKLTEPATSTHGIMQLSDEEIRRYRSIYESYLSKQLAIVKFVPASGAASRMFTALYHALDRLKKGDTASEIRKDPSIGLFFSNLKQFAFFGDLEKTVRQNGSNMEEVDPRTILECFLLENGLNCGKLPKGLLKFHRYPDKSRTPVEEHLVEGASYAAGTDGKVKIHFTVSPEHQQLFEKHLTDVLPHYETLFSVKFEIDFSQQKSSTDTIAVSPDNLPFRNEDNTLLFRPAGHGALLENLNEIESDLIFIKNIDNVVPESGLAPTIGFKKALAGLLLNVQEKIFYYQKKLRENLPNTLESAFYAEAANFLENVLLIRPPLDQYYSEKEELYHYFNSKFNRPLRVCGMVKNLGEPGGGPFFTMNDDGSVSLQIVESSQIDQMDPEQAYIAQNATHFNPVDLVCATRNFKGEKYHLPDFRDNKSGFIANKTNNGKELKAQELPGLWNGAMANWNTIFVEVPVETFNPVKTVNDLLRKEHRQW